MARSPRRHGRSPRPQDPRLARLGAVALAVILLVCAATLGWSFRNLLGVDPGFDSQGVLTFDVSLSRARLDTFAKRQQLLESVLAEVRAVPGVAAVCAINEIPFDPGGFASMTYVPEGRRKPSTRRDDRLTRVPRASARWLLRGRTFTARDATRLAIVTESFARQAWPDGDALGRLRIGVKEGPLARSGGRFERARPSLTPICTRLPRAAPSGQACRAKLSVTIAEAVFASRAVNVRQRRSRTRRSWRHAVDLGRGAALTAFSLPSGTCISLMRSRRGRNGSCPPFESHRSNTRNNSNLRQDALEQLLSLGKRVEACAQETPRQTSAPSASRTLDGTRGDCGSSSPAWPRRRAG